MECNLFNDNISPKLKIIFYTLVNGKYIIKDDPIPNLLKQYSEIKNFYGIKNLTKFLYYNYKNIHKILYEYDEIIRIEDTMLNDLSFNFYLCLLIESETEIINYQYSIKYIDIFNLKKNNNDKKYYNIIISKIIIKLINNLKNCDNFDENKDGEYITNLENKNKEYIINNIYIFKEINLDININDIYEINIDEFYFNIITALIKNDKLTDYEFANNILIQLDLENIDIPFNDKLFNKLLEVLDTNNNYIKVINDINDLNDIKIINFYYLLFKYILKSSFYIYHIPLLYEAHIKIIDILKTNKNISFTNQIIIERIEYIIRKLCDSDYYFNTKYLLNISDNEMYIKYNILKNSICIFNISIKTNQNPIINEIQCIYGLNKIISFEEMIKIQDINNDNKLELNYILYINYLCLIKNIIENQTSEFQFDYNFRMIFEFQNTENKNDNISIINVKYKLDKHPFLKIDTEYSDNNILGKKLNEFIGFISFLNAINLKNKDLNNITESSICNNKELTNIISLINKTENNLLEIISDENEYRILKFEKLIYKHKESIKFFLCLKDGYYFSCGNDPQMILYDYNYNKILIINNLDNILYNISEKISGNKKYIELIACYGINIYLIKINKDNLIYETKKYEIPNMKTLYCKQILNYYIITGINNIIKVEDLFNDQIALKKMYKISSDVFKTGLYINKNYIIFISHNLIPNGINQLVICNLNNNQIEHTIKEYSFNLNETSLCLIKLNNNKQFLLCACKSYNNNQKNGILIVDMNFKSGDNIKYIFYDTHNFEVYCFCQIENTNLFFVGGFDLDKRIGLIKLFILDENKIKYLQDIELDEINKSFEGFDMPVNNIIQKKDNGKIIITTINGDIYLFSKPNINYYLKELNG